MCSESDRPASGQRDSRLVCAERANRSAGAPVVWLPQESRPGVTIAMVEDPDGKWLELIQMA